MQKCKTRSEIWIFIVLLSLAISAAQAQTNVSVNLVKGNAQIGYPLGQVGDNEISVPIGLSYNATGVQISEKGYGEFGLGVNWNLSAGGSISREVRALPDDFKGVLNDPRKGWLIGTTAQDVANYQTGTSLGAFTYADTEPDIFSISMPSLSLSFVFDINKQIKTIPYSDVQIIPYYTDPVNHSDIYKFEVIAGDGLIYEFAEYEISNKYTSELSYPVGYQIGYFLREYNLYGVYKPTFFKSEWKLTKITARDGRNLTIRYENAKPFTYTDPRIFTLEDGVSYSLFTTYNTIFMKRVVEVVSATNRAYFNYNHGNFQAYDHIDFFDNSSGLEKKVRSYSLNYKNIFHKKNNSTEPIQENSMRRFLESITEHTECSSLPASRFNYYGVDFETEETLLPEQGSYKQDIWGLFNDSPDIESGESTHYMHPLTPEMHTYQFTASSYIQYGFPAMLPGWTQKYGPGAPPINENDYESQYSYLPGRNRSVNPNTVFYGSLSTVYNVYGGYTKIEYEPNEYRHPIPEFGEVAFTGKGLRVKKMSVFDGISHDNDQVKEYEYKDTDGKTSGKAIFPPQFNLSDFMVRSTFDMAPSSKIYYRRVTTKEPGKGKTVYEYLVPATFPASSDGDWKSTTNYQYPFSPDMEYDFERSLPYRKYEYKEENLTTPISETQYEYQRISLNSLEIKALNFDFPFYFDVDLRMLVQWPHGPETPIGSYKQLVNTGKVLLSEKNFITDPSNTQKLESSVHYYYEGTNHKFPTRTVSVNSDGTTYESRVKYAIDFNGITSSTDPATSAIKTMNSYGMHKTPIENISYAIKNGTSKVLSATLLKYKVSENGMVLLSQTLQLPHVDNYVPAYLESLAGGQKLVADNRFILVKEMEAYQGVKPLTINDGKGRRNAFHWGYASTTPVVEISNAAANQVVFSNFETSTGNNFNVSSPVYVPGNIVGKALSLPANTFIYASLSKGTGKYYRFTCKIKTSVNGSLTVQLNNGSTTISTTNIPYTANSKWQFLEKQLDVASLNNTFSIKVSGTTATLLDDIAFYPAIAAMKSATYEPGKGKTSESDFKGNSLFYEYDNMGKLTYIRDTEGNILQKNEYKFYNYVSNRPKSGFTGSYNQATSLYPGCSALYTSDENCLSSVTHSWHVNGVLASTYPQCALNFTNEGKYVVRHTVTHPTLGTSTTERSEYVFSSKNVKFGISVSGAETINSCETSYSRTFSSGISSNSFYTVEWEILSTTGNNWEPAGSGVQITLCRAEDYAIRFKATATAPGFSELISEEKFIHFYKDTCPVTINASCPYPYKPVVKYGYTWDEQYASIDISHSFSSHRPFWIEKMKRFGPEDQTQWLYVWEVFENNQWVEHDRFTDDVFAAHNKQEVIRSQSYVNPNFKVRCRTSPVNSNVWYTSDEISVTFCICPKTYSDFLEVKYMMDVPGLVNPSFDICNSNSFYLINGFSVRDMMVTKNPKYAYRSGTIYIWEISNGNDQWIPMKVFTGNAFLDKNYDTNLYIQTKRYSLETENPGNTPIVYFKTPYYVRCTVLGGTIGGSISDILSPSFYRSNPCPNVNPGGN